MAAMRTTAIFVAIFLSTTFFFIVTTAQAPAPGPSTTVAYGPSGDSVPGPVSTEDDCLTKVLNMSDCLSYVEAGSNVTVPDKPCCPELAGLVESNPICLCELLGKSDSYGIKIDLDRALKLPSVCGVNTPSATLCSAIGIPIGAPTSATEGPGGMPPEGLAANPSAGTPENGASSHAGSFLAIVSGLLIAFLI